MKKLAFAFFTLASGAMVAQTKFAQLDQLLPTANSYRAASGAPGHAYYQQKADYKMTLVLDDNKQRLDGTETIAYTNNSPDPLAYLWLQLDQNIYDQNAESKLIEVEKMENFKSVSDLRKRDFYYDGGFKIEKITNMSGQPMTYFINKTMMRIDLAKPLMPGQNISFQIKWWYNVNDRMQVGGRSGYEYFEADKNYLYTIAQFFPRMCVYNDVTGWQNKQFLGRGEFTLPFGDYEVSITVPADHIVAATGECQNYASILSPEQRKRYELAKKSDTPVVIVTQAEAEAAEKNKAQKTKTWVYKATNVRDFAFATSRKFIWDAQKQTVGGKDILCMSYYPKEGNPLWERYSTKLVAHTIKTYSKYTVNYMYPVAISVHSKWIGMEYPMICFNGGRPEADGTYSEGEKYGMWGVIIHEVGHNFFPMIINSDERQWTWMDEGINSFVEILAELDYDPNFYTGNLPKDIVRYMSIDQNNLSPIMSQGDYVKNFGPNAYTKPAAGLYMLRQTIMGPELFDYAFRTYSQRWMFKHPSPADFFRTMEDASAMDLDWFWRGWFFTTDYNDIGLKEVKKYNLTDQPTQEARDLAKRYNMNLEDYKGKLVFFEEEKEGVSVEAKKALDIGVIKDYMASMSEDEKNSLKEAPNFFYEVTFEKPGGLVMPIIVELEYVDGTKERQTFPAQIWRYNDKEVSKVFRTSQEIKKITIDPDLETADIDTSNNSWPKKDKSKFDKFKKFKIKG